MRLINGILTAAVLATGVLHLAPAHAAVPVTVPEPGVLGLMAVGLVAIGWARRRRR